MKRARFLRAAKLLACLWIIGATFWGYSKVNELAHGSGEFWQDLCNRGETLELKGKDCNQVYKERAAERVEAEWGIIPLVSLGPIAFLLTILLLSYLSVRATYWVKTGLLKAPENASIYKHTMIGAMVILALLGLQIAMVSARLHKIENAMGRCKFEAVKQNIGEPYGAKKEPYKSFVRACMEGEGHKLMLNGSSLCYDTPYNADCYR
jgi:hypothetical protein